MIDETYSFTKEDLDTCSQAFRVHVAQCGGNDGRYKMPKHWMKFTIYSPPRSGRLYKGFQCNCGWEFYLIKDGTEKIIKPDVTG